MCFTATHCALMLARIPKHVSGEANDAISVHNQVKMNDATRLLKLLKRNAQQSGSGSLETVVRHIGKTSMTQWSHQIAICMTIHWQACYGKTIGGDLVASRLVKTH